ncbi:hypothetical protein BJX70DRAFT_395416 [Aspergillus crustosus]
MSNSISGILMGIKLQKHLSHHLYQYSFAPNPDWSQFYWRWYSYASSQEIQGYLKAVVEEYNLNPSISYNSRVIHAQWQARSAAWTIEIENHGVIESEILISAGGILNNPQMPEIPGLDTFGGPLLHTAAWNDSVDLRGKRVAIIGAGASAVQLLPKIQPLVDHVDVYIRTLSWISPPVALPNGVSKFHVYSEEEKEAFRADPESYRQMRKGLENQFNEMFSAFMKDSPEQQRLRGRFESTMKALIQDKSLQENLIPKFEAGCRRVNPGEEYLVALQETNVRPIFKPIREITRKAVVMDDGEENTAEILIAATGFNTSFRPRFPDLWETDLVSYFGIAVSGFPNYLMFLGPNTPISNGSLMGPLEATSDYVVRVIRKVVRQRIRTFDIQPEVQVDFDNHTQEFMQDMVWTGTCRSWYKNNKTGKITALWPGSSLHYMQSLAEDRWEDYRFEYGGNQFEQRSQRMSTVPDQDSDLSFYLADGVPLQRGGVKEKSVL